MDVLESGKPPDEREFEATCRTCGSLLRFKQSEGRSSYDQRDGDFVTVTCPVCGNSVHANLRGR